jgi:RNA polymerase sigma factor (sigma-70 family)
MEDRQHLTPKAQRDYKLIVEVIQSGNQRIFTQIMEQYKDCIYFMLLKITNNIQDAEDLTLDTFGKAFNNLHQYVPEYAFSTWLFRIASNNGIDFLRRKRKNVLDQTKSQHIDDSAIATDMPCLSKNPEEKFLNTQQRQLIRELVSTLPTRYKMLVEMHYFEGLSYEEICQKLDLPLGTVKGQLFRAREFLCEFINKTEDF